MQQITKIMHDDQECPNFSILETYYRSASGRRQAGKRTWLHGGARVVEDAEMKCKSCIFCIHITEVAGLTG